MSRPPQPSDRSEKLESVVYNTVLEETGGSDAFEKTIGRVRLVESVALVASALAGGAIAAVAPLRVTSFFEAGDDAVGQLVESYLPPEGAP